MERRLLGIMLEQPRLIPAIEDVLGRDSSIFARYGHGEVYRSILELGPATDIEMVVGRLSDEATRALEKPVTYLAQCQDLAYGYTTKDQAAHAARLLRSSRHARTALHLCKTAAADLDGGADPSAMLAQLATELDLARADDQRIVPISQADLAALEIAPPDSILGNGILSIGDWGLIHAREGVGKTWAILELAACLAAGKPWFGLHVPRRFRVGICSLEMGRYHARSRLGTVMDAFGFDEESRASVERDILWITKDECPVLDICKPTNQAWLVDWCAGEGVHVLFLDPLSQFFFGDENSREGVATLLHFLQSFPSRSNGCTPIVSHHDRKQSQQGDQGDHASAARGSVALMGSARSSFRLVRMGEEPGSPIQLVCDKSNNAPRPAPIWLRQDDTTGRLVLGSAPQTRAQLAVDRVLEFLSSVPEASTEEVAETCHRTPEWTRKTLKRLEEEGETWAKQARREDGKGWKTIWGLSERSTFQQRSKLDDLERGNYNNANDIDPF